MRIIFLLVLLLSWPAAAENAATKVPHSNDHHSQGAVLQCYQAGRLIIYEPGLQNLKCAKQIISVTRQNGLSMTIIFGEGSGVVCQVVG